MTSTKNIEYLCPQCGHVNGISKEEIKDMYQEQYAACEQCHSRLELVPACGIGDQINLIVSVAPPDLPER